MIYAIYQGHAPHLQTCLLILTALPIAISAVFHPESPCPTVFNYEGNEPEFDRWYGEVQLVSNDDLLGVVLNIKFDRTTHLLVSWMGDVTSQDNIMYTILNLNERLTPKIPIHSRFMVKFNGTRGSPRVKSIRLNGRQICPPEINVVNELQQKPKVTTDKNHRVVTKRPDPVFPDTYTTSYYQDFMTPTTPRHRPKTTEIYAETDDLPYGSNGNGKPSYQPASSSGVNKNKVSSSTNTSPNRPQTEYNGYDNSYDSGNTHVVRPSGNNREPERDNYNGASSGSNYSPPKNPVYEITSNPNNNKPNTHFSSGDDGSLYPSGSSGSKNINYNNPSNSGNYNSQSGGGPSVVRPTNNKKPSTTNNYNSYNEENVYNPAVQPPNYNVEDKPRPTSINTGNKKPSGNNYNNFDEDSSYVNPSVQPSNYNTGNKPKQPDSYNSPNIMSNLGNNGRPSGSSIVSPPRPTNIEHIPTGSGNNRPYSISQTNQEDRKPVNNNNGYDSGVSSNTGASNNYNNGYNNGASNNGYNTGANNGNGNGYDSGAAQPYRPPSSNSNTNFAINAAIDSAASTIDKTDNLGLDVQPSKSDKTVIITSIHKNTYVFPAGTKKEGEDLSFNANENSYNGDASGNRVTTPNYNQFGSDVKPSVKPSNPNSNKQNSGNGGNNSGGKKPAQTSKPQATPNREQLCGVISSEAAAVGVPLVTNGQATARGQWPWHVALYKTDGINLTYICGGSLVAKNIVVTAAHCVTKKPYDRPVDSNTIVIYLGKYHLQQYSDDGGIQIKQVLEIVPYTTYNSSNYLGDIAILKMTSNAEYTNYVRPVCLWDSRVTELSSVVDKEGTVIGWGYDEHDKASEELKMAKMPVVSQETCIYSNRPFFSQFTSNKTFCAGFRNGTSVCNGDSGGGMIFSRGSTWYLRGIVSISVAQSGLRKCDTKHYVVFTDVAKYLDWVNNYVQKHRA